MFSLHGLLDWVIGIGDSISDWITLTFRGDSIASVLAFLRVSVSFIPTVILDLGLAAFGGMIVISILKSIGR